MSTAAAPAVARSTGETRPEILVLRGIAILAILVHHLWQGRLPGGFAALDVFFVISGYLVTRILFGMRERGGIDIWAYLARRARRILPSAITVLLACLVGMFAFVSITDWGRTAGELLASAVFMENWALIAADLAYAAPDSATALQHYWTLAVEAQFYVAWALLMMVLLGRGAAFGAHRRRAGAIGIAVVLAISLAVSVVWCALAPVSGYLSTATRIWELAAGGLLAVLVRRIPPLRVGAPLAIAGWALIAGSLVLLNTSMAWPGFLAVIPVAGAVLVIAAGVPHDAPRLRRLTDNRFTRDLADSSYAIYLWHWPILVFADRALGHPPGTPRRSASWSRPRALGWADDRARGAADPVRRSRARPQSRLSPSRRWRSRRSSCLRWRCGMSCSARPSLYTAAPQAPAADLCAGAEARMPGADCGRSVPGVSPDPLGEWEEVSVLHAMGLRDRQHSARRAPLRLRRPGRRCARGPGRGLPRHEAVGSPEGDRREPGVAAHHLPQGAVRVHAARGGGHLRLSGVARRGGRTAARRRPVGPRRHNRRRPRDRGRGCGGGLPRGG
ncbi:MAG: acyltransferase [Schumannella sp.]